jgi:hypothetical protein
MAVLFICFSSQCFWQQCTFLIEFSSSAVHNFIIGVVRRTVGDIIGLEENYEVLAVT